MSFNVRITCPRCHHGQYVFLADGGSAPPSCMNPDASAYAEPGSPPEIIGIVRGVCQVCGRPHDGEDVDAAMEAIG